MKVRMSNISFEIREVEVADESATRTKRRYEKLGWECIRSLSADGRTALRFRRQPTPNIEVTP